MFNKSDEESDNESTKKLTKKLIKKLDEHSDEDLDETFKNSSIKRLEQILKKEKNNLLKIKKNICSQQ